MVREDSAGSCSKNVFFDGKIISDYFRSDKNRAVTIDDFSGEFRSDPNLDVFVVIDSFLEILLEPVSISSRCTIRRQIRMRLLTSY